MMNGTNNIRMYASHGDAGGRLGIAKASAMCLTKEVKQSTSLRINSEIGRQSLCLIHCCPEEEEGYYATNEEAPSNVHVGLEH